MEVLVYGNRKQDDVSWDISTPEKRTAGFLALFNYLKDNWQVYECDYWGEKQQEAEQKKLYKKAIEGDGDAAEKLLKMRIRYEYENWKTMHVRG